MKKILIGILTILLIIVAYLTVFRGISIGNFSILSVEQIQEENDNLTTEIAQTETLMYSTYATQTEQLEKSVSSLLEAKEEYLDLANVSTESELSEASKEETYKIEYLWTRIGSHATTEGVILKLDVQTGGTGESDVKNLSFTVTGNYIAIINFVTAIEDDSELGFRIENFKILPGTDTDGREATFTVRNVRIKQENITTNVTNAENTENTDNTENAEENNANNTANTAEDATENTTENTNADTIGNETTVE